MQTKDYKAIAEIIKNNKKGFAKKNIQDVSMVWGVIEALDIISKELADYFEKQNKKENREIITIGTIFNKEQFLKDCGVTE